MSDPPGWIQLLYNRHNVWHALHTAFLLESTQEFIAKEVDLQPDGREQLRRVALGELGSDDPQVVAWSLVCLGVVGRPEDTPAVEQFLAHSSELVQRAAKTCRFELRSQDRAKGGDTPLSYEVGQPRNTDSH